MNILITGCNGQLGTEMRVLSQQHPTHTYFFTDIAELDISNRDAVLAFVCQHSIDLIVNCAAYTNVDKAEADEDTARVINAQAVENLALAGTRIIHISTDYVFSGEGWIPYKESDVVAPRTAYGRTKYEGEQRLQNANSQAVIIRTAWLYSAYGNNFVKTMLRLAQEKESLGVVFDQIGTPTYAADLAATIFSVIEAPEWHPGIYHFTNEGVCSWYDFTHEILIQAAKMLNQDTANRLKTCKLHPILSSEYQYKTPRPHYSVLDKSKIKKTFGIEIPYWTDGLQRCLRQLFNV